MASTLFPRLPDRPLSKRGRTDETFLFSAKNIDKFPRFHIIHTECPEMTARLVSPFLVSKCLTDIIGPGYKATKMASGDLLLEVQNKTQYDKLNTLLSFGNTPITVTAHRSLNTVRGVVSDSDLLNLTENELLDGWKDENVIQVQRIKIRRNDQEIPTKHLILTFGSSILPEYIQAGYIKIRVRPYIPNPRRCFKCQKFGHSSQSCRGRTSCAKCGANNEHTAENCTSDPHCSNCDGDHPAYSRSCPAWKREKEIITLKVKENISFNEARKRFSFVKPSYADTVRVGAAPHRPLAAVRTTHSGPAAATSAPSVVAAAAAPPSSKKDQQASEPVAFKAPAHAVRPDKSSHVPRERANSASQEAMDTSSCPSTPLAQRERRGSLERAKKEKSRITAPQKNTVP
ncbi:uncharacterized protein LOC125940962 [Dermacentor silvarum]|uniref:uncharacterized protein LOC125940962 n=1 Tax=Dermacentor silvarum TaxID=543639 RepID=UPI002100A9B1|nr:uncharacterized protein LOC125940962 [Dermacentor silvarum]